MTAFDKQFDKTFALEGGESNHPSDRGHHTKFGITETLFRRAIADGVICNVSDIGDLTPIQSKAIYEHYFWTFLNLNLIEDPDIAGEIFDTAVNMGPGAAVKIAQQAVNYLGEKLAEDGAIGSRTIQAINKWAERDKRALFVCLNGFQFIRYVAITSEGVLGRIEASIKGDSSQTVFARGWTKRIQQYQT